MDPLDSFRELVGSARVVGIGESAHYVREYTVLRHRMTRILVEELGFTLVTVESGFSEGLLVNRWVRGGEAAVAEVGAEGMTYRFGEYPEMQDFLAWMREVNAAGGDVSYAGLDLPADLASLLPPLDSLDGYLADVDPDGGALVGQARRLAERFAARHTMPAFAAYRDMDTADRDRLTLLLAGLSARFDAMRPLYVRRTGADRFETTRHELRLAVQLDQMLRTQVEAADAGIPAVVNIRDTAMAETALRLLDRRGGRMVLLAANTHLQRVPMRLDQYELPVAGVHLADALGDDYVAVALTCDGGRTPSRRPAPDAPGRVELVGVDLPAPVEGSVEAYLRARRDGLHVTDLRPLRRAAGFGPQRLRVMDGYLDVPVAHAFDLVARVPTISPATRAA